MGKRKRRLTAREVDTLTERPADRSRIEWLYEVGLRARLARLGKVPAPAPGALRALVSHLRRAGFRPWQLLDAVNPWRDLKYEPAKSRVTSEKTLRGVIA